MIFAYFLKVGQCPLGDGEGRVKNAGGILQGNLLLKLCFKDAVSGSRDVTAGTLVPRPINNAFFCQAFLS